MSLRALIEAKARRTVTHPILVGDAAADTETPAVVHVELQSLEPAEWDALCDSLPEDPDGGYDVTPMRAELMAACCTDPELQDPEWWRQQFTRPEWSKGDLVAVNYMLVGLNLSTPGAAGKG